MTGQAGKVARGLRTIGANITQLAQSSKSFDIQVNGATKSIQLWNEAGTDMLNTYDVLKQISAAWDDMTNAEKSSLAITLAKKTQMDTFLAILGNFEDAEKSYVTSLTSEGSAWKENAEYMKSIEAHQAKLKAQWEQFALSLPIEDLEKALLNLGTALLKLANNDIVQFLTKLTLVAVTTGLIAKTIGTFVTVTIPAIISALYGWATATVGLTASMTSLEAVMVAVNGIMMANPLFLAAAALAAGIFVAAKAINYFSKQYERLSESVEENNKAYEEAQNEIEDLTSKIEELQKVIDENEQKKLQLTDEQDIKNLERETKELKLQEAIYQNQLAIAKAKANEAQREAKANAEKLKTTNKTAYVHVVEESPYSGNDVIYNNTASGTPAEVFQQQVEALNNLLTKIQEYRDRITELSKDYDANEEEIKQLTSWIDTLTDYYMEDSQAATETAEEIQSIIEAGADENGVLQELIDSYSDTVNVAEEVIDGKEGIADASEDAAENLDEEADAVEETTDALTEQVNALKDVQDAYDTLKAAVDEYNQKGAFTAETIAKLNALSPEYLAALVKEGDQYSINTSLLAQQFEVEKQELVKKLEIAKCIAEVNLCQQYLNQTTAQAATTTEAAGNAAETASGQWTDLGFAAAQAAAAIQAVNVALGGDASTYDQFKKDLADLQASFDAQIDAVKNSELDLSNTAKSSAGSHKDAWVEAFEKEKDALKNLLETDEITEYEYYQRLKELNEKYFGEISGNHEKYIKEYNENEEEIYKGLKSVYDKVRDYLAKAVESGYEKAINALKKEEKAVLAEIKSQIDALKKQKDSVLKGIKSEIDALKKQKEAVQKYYNDQIDALKRENEELEKQNELLEYQQKLQQAKAQKVMVMQEGRFTLTENESAVSQAEANLSNYQDQLSYEQQIQQLEDLRDAQVESIEARIEALEEYYDYMEEYYDNQIEAMEEYYDQVQEQYEKQIEALQEQLDTFKEGYQKSEDLDNARLAAEVLAANEEASVWAQRLENLAQAVTEYNKLMALLGEPGASASSEYSAGVASYNPIASVSGVEASIQSRAIGDSNFADDEVAVVGESPNAELVLGSKLNRSVNSGQLVHLSRGSGVVNAESTSTLAGLLNGLADPQKSTSLGRNTSQNFNFGNITLPNVTDADSFVKTLSTKFNNYAIQYGNVRR